VTLFLFLAALAVSSAAPAQAVDRRAEADCPLREALENHGDAAAAIATCTARYGWTPAEVVRVRRMAYASTRMLSAFSKLKKANVDTDALRHIYVGLSPDERELVGNLDYRSDAGRTVVLKLAAQMHAVGITRDSSEDAIAFIVFQALLDREYGLFLKEHH
jgi:hypothetical protein